MHYAKICAVALSEEHRKFNQSEFFISWKGRKGGGL